MPLPSQIYATGVNQSVADEDELKPFEKKTLRLPSGGGVSTLTDYMKPKSGSGEPAQVNIELTDAKTLENQKAQRLEAMSRAQSGELNPDNYIDAQYIKENNIKHTPASKKDSKANENYNFEFGPDGKRMAVVTVPSSKVPEYKEHMRRQMSRSADIKAETEYDHNEPTWRAIYNQMNPGLADVNSMKALPVPRSVTYGEGGTVTLDRSPEDKLRSDANQAKLKKDSDIRGMFK